MRTALQELIEYINEMKSPQTLMNGHDIDTVHMPSLEHKISELLELEKKQIIDAFTEGEWEQVDVNGEKYYNDTFTNP